MLQKEIDVVMLTCNSEKYLKTVLDSVYREIPVHHLIIVDGYSTDQTLKIISQYPNVKIIQTKAKLGKCRELGIKTVDTEWFVFVDSDVVLRRGWLNTVRKYVSNNVGAVEGLDILMSPQRRAWQIGMQKFRQKKRKELDTSRIRAFTGDTLIRTEAVRGINIPKNLNVFEDQYIRKYIEQKGYRWVKTREYICKHYDFKPPNRTFSAGQAAYHMKYLTVKRAFFNFIKSFPYSLIAFHYSKEWRVIPFQIKWQLYYFLGALKSYFMT